MKVVMIAAAIGLLAAAPSYAQSGRGYALASSGFANNADGTSSDTFLEAGGHAGRRLFVFGDVGQLRNLEPSELQPAVDSTTAQLSGAGVSVAGTSRVPATYMLGGLRLNLPAKSRVSPYVFGGIGMAHVSPRAQFIYGGGTLPDGSTPNVGDDVTTSLTSLGDYTAPAATNNAMISFGGGVAVPVAKHLAADVGYRYSRVSTDTPLNTQGVTFGFGYRF